MFAAAETGPCEARNPELSSGPLVDDRTQAPELWPAASRVCNSKKLESEPELGLEPKSPEVGCTTPLLGL